MDIRSLLHNKWALGGVGVAAAAGAFALYRRKSSTGSTSSSSTGAQASPAYSAGGVGRFDSTGTDVAAWMGNYSQNLQTQLDQFKQDIAKSPGTGVIPPVPTGTGPAPTPAPAPAPPPGGTYVRASKGQTFTDWYSGLKGRGLQPTYDQLNAWNPTQWGVPGAPVGIMGNTYSHPDHSLDYFNADAVFRVS